MIVKILESCASPAQFIHDDERVHEKLAINVP
jgi:hypothetical protein